VSRKQITKHVSNQTLSRLIEKFGQDGAEAIMQALDERFQKVENEFARSLAVTEQSVTTGELVQKEVFESEIKRLEDLIRSEVRRLENLIRSEVSRIEEKIKRIEDKLTFIIVLLILGFTVFNPSFIGLIKSLLR